MECNTNANLTSTFMRCFWDYFGWLVCHHVGVETSRDLKLLPDCESHKTSRIQDRNLFSAQRPSYDVIEISQRSGKVRYGENHTKIFTSSGWKASIVLSFLLCTAIYFND